MSRISPWSNPPGSAAGTYVAGGTDVAVADGGTGASTAQAAAQNLGVPYRILHSALPLIKASSGSMGNNGAITAMTALAFTYASAYIYLPAGAIAAGVPAAADWYYFVGSSTTAGTVFNNTLSANLSARGEPQIPASPTAFSTTGPGAFTGVTAEVTALTATIPAGALGVTGRIRVVTEVTVNNTAGAKVYKVHYSGVGGNAFASPSIVSTTGWRGETIIENRGATNVQVGSTSGLAFVAGSAQLGTFPILGAVDTTASTTVVITATVSGAATDGLVFETCYVEIVTN
jgi:hypothetical protein